MLPKVEHKLPASEVGELSQSTWSNWEDVEKVIINNKEYGNLLYTRHALENTYPASLGRVAGHTSNHPPVGIPPNFVQMIIESPYTKVYEKVKDGIGRTIYETENIRVITENNIVVTISRKK
ncbi:MAG: hypothetical protein LF885_03100 [Rickettsia endosymbiont of Culicoides impunctatus]|uniref:hypothetical protein n=1 Tax=unclassified Candidatus Tisiphia TaxID=2996318 RepID=UPI001E7FB216|nr:MAG: hypothetical protein LF885_03100 [Rickettsia endosymbiont of Culicoides impunctatus]